MGNSNGQIFGVARDTLGNALSQADVYVYERDTTTEVALTEDRFSAVAVAQPLVADGNGKYSAGIRPGIYDIRIMKDGFDKTWQDVYVDQVDWVGYDRRGRLGINLADDFGIQCDFPEEKFEPEEVEFTLDSYLNGSSIGAPAEFEWAGAPGPDVDCRIYYRGTEDRMVKVNLFAQWWWEGEDTTGEYAYLYIVKNGSGIFAANDAILVIDEDPSAAYGNSLTTFPHGLYTWQLVEMSTDDYVEIWKAGQGGVDTEIKKMRFWVE